MRMLEKLLIIAVFVLPLLGLFLWFQPQIHSWVAGRVATDVATPPAHYACVDGNGYTCTPWCRTREEAAENARQNGQPSDRLMVWYDNEADPRLLEGNGR